MRNSSSTPPPLKNPKKTKEFISFTFKDQNTCNGMPMQYEFLANSEKAKVHLPKQQLFKAIFINTTRGNETPRLL